MDIPADYAHYYSMSNRLSFLLSPEVSKLFNHFTGLFDVRIAYYTPDGRELAVGMDRSWCDYCRLLREELGDDALCVQADRSGRERAMQTRGLVSYQCHGGLLEAVKPLYTNDELIGFIMIGQVRTGDPLPPATADRWATIQAAKHAGKQTDKQTVKQADTRLAEGWNTVPLIPRERIGHLLPLFSSLVDLIISRHMISILGRHPLDPIIARMTEHPEEQLDLAAVAALVGKSPDRTAHLFTEACGKSFKNLQKDLRMQHAARLLAGSSNPGMKEVAALCGYGDPLYFSRVFRAHFGLPPSKFRRRTG